MKLTSLTLALVIGSTGFTVQASTSTLYELDSSKTTTAVSGGSTSNSSKSIGGTSGFKAINRITNWETADQPCKIKVKMRHLNKYNETTDSADIYSPCTGDKITVGYSDRDSYISGVQVCANSAGNEIKGLRVWGYQIDRSTGALNSLGKVEDTRQRCSIWKAKRLCPAGKVVTEIKANYTGYSVGVPSYEGIQLICQEIIPQ